MSENSPIDWKVESQRFDGVAEMYDRFRPTYPAALIDDLINLSGIVPESDLLEIGCGTGQSTMRLAERGFSPLCVEPGQHLAAIAAKNLAAYPNIRFVSARFEEWDAGERRFDLIYASQAIHWVPKEIRYSKTGTLLKPQGHLAMIYNLYPGLKGEIGREVDEVYRQRTPEIAGPAQRLDPMIEERAASVRQSPYFDQVTVTRHSWSAFYSTAEFLGVLNTYSNHLRLSAEKRADLFKGIAEVVEQHGGTIERPYEAVLFLGRRV